MPVKEDKWLIYKIKILLHSARVITSQRQLLEPEPFSDVDSFDDVTKGEKKSDLNQLYSGEGRLVHQQMMSARLPSAGSTQCSTKVGSGCSYCKATALSWHSINFGKIQVLSHHHNVFDIFCSRNVL